MDAALQQAVGERAKQRCEYCHFPAEFAELPFHHDHIIAQQHGGETTLDNLAFACCHCNRYKGPNLSSVDPISSQVVPLFHPRQDKWGDHFSWHGAMLIGNTSTGRATIRALRLNRSDAVAVRQLLMQEGVFPAEM